MCSNVKIHSTLWIAFVYLFTQGKFAESNVVCGNANKYFDSCLKNNITNGSQLFGEHSNNNNIPLTKEEIKDHCNKFNHGMQCYSDYKDKCLSDATNRRLIEGEVLPAKNFYEMLCKDNKFKTDYLSHRDCFRYIEKLMFPIHAWTCKLMIMHKLEAMMENNPQDVEFDMAACREEFHEVVGNEFMRTLRERKSNLDEQYMHFCCARHAYEKCVENSARAKCKPTSARFATSVVELLSSERQFKNCATIERTLCSSFSARINFSKVCFVASVLISFLCAVFNQL